MLKIKDLKASINGKEILKGINIPATASATTALFNIRTTFYVLFATRNK